MALEHLDWQGAENDNRRACPICDGEVTGHARKKYCSKQCSRKAEALVRDYGAAKERALARAPEQKCEQCRETFKGVAKDGKPLRFCSRACGARHTKDANTTASMITKAIKYGHGVERPLYRIYRPLCAECGTRFNTKNPNALYCSDGCAGVAMLRRQAQRYHDEQETDRRPRPCVECGVTFAPEYGVNSRRSYCSELCLKKGTRRVAKGVRNARMRGLEAERVNPIAIFIRDGWVCQICGVDTPREKRGTYDSDAPELDHVIPLARGGPHTNDNVQCACRSCNAAKSDSMPVAA